MKRCLTWWDLIWFGFGSVIGAGIFVLTGQETHDHAGPAIVLSYVASGISAMLSVFCYTEFSVEIPVAGGSFAYLRIELGDFVAFITAGNILLESVVGSAAVSRAWTSYFTSLLNRPSNSLRFHTNLTEGYNLLDPIAVVVLAVAATITMISTRKTSYLNWITSAISNVVILFVLIAGFSHANLSNMKPFMPFGPKGVFQAAAIVYFAYGGFDNIATMAEETKNPSRDIPIGLLGSMSIITVVYCLMALSLPMMQKYTDIDTGAAYSMAFHSVGMTWAKYLVALGALKGMTTVLLVGTLGQARYNTHIARAHMIPPWFALVHPKTGTPTLDICFKFLHCFLFKLECLDRPVIGEHTLYLHDDGSCTSSEKILCDRCHPKTTSLEASCLLGDHYFFLYRDFSLLEIKSQWLDWLCSDSSNLVLRDFGNVSVSTSTEVTKSLGGSTGSLVAILVNRHKYFSYGISEFFCFATNIFLMGSLSSSAFIRFGICTAVMLIYYAFFGLHATYDMAHKKGMPESPEPLKVVNSNSREKAEP